MSRLRNFRVPDDEWEAFKSFAEADGRTASAVLRELIRGYVETGLTTPLVSTRPVSTPSEAVCDRCGGANALPWHAPSPLWNAVMRDPVARVDRYSIVCPTCFIAEAQRVGVVSPKHHWHLEPHGLDIASLWLDSEGRTWNPETCLWEAPARKTGRFSSGPVSLAPREHKEPTFDYDE